VDGSPQVGFRSGTPVGSHQKVKHSSFSSVQFSKDICIAQLSRMSHCAPAAGKPVRFKFTPEARVGDVLVA